MQGSTNCSTSKTGEFEYIWAINGTGGLVAAGTKVWLNFRDTTDLISDISDWFAEPFDKADIYSLTGFTTGRVDNNGRIEVKTVLPETAIYTVTITPDEDTFKFKGEAL